MNNYLALSSKYLNRHKRKTRLAVTGIAIAVALVAGIFSMVDSLLQFERQQVLEREGNYHTSIRNPSMKEVETIRNRVDVEASGTMKDLGNGDINGTECALAAIDAGFAPDLNFDIKEGSYPETEKQVMVEVWYAEKCSPALKPGDTVKLSLPDGTDSNFVISGIFNDWGATKSVGVPGVFVSMKFSEKLAPRSSQYFIRFKDGVNILGTEGKIKQEFGIKDERIGRNEALLGLIGQSKNNKVLEYYAIGAILFCLVLITAMVMIYNTFNISVMDRVRMFGVLRCIGASKAQVKRLVRREGFFLMLKAVPVGIAAGILMSISCAAVLKYFNGKIFGNISLVHFSAAGILAGVAVGVLTVYAAMLLPARRASGVSPVNAVRGCDNDKITRTEKKGILIKLFRAHIAMGVFNAFGKKRTLLLMSSSIAFSIIMFLGFSVLVNPLILGIRPIKVYTADISLRSRQVIDHSIFTGISELDGVKRAFGRMTGEVDINFDASKLIEKYAKLINASKGKDGLIATPPKSWLVSYDSMQIKWAGNDLTSGRFNEAEINEKNGIIAVEKNWNRNVLYQAVRLKPGDRVYIKTVSGTRTFTILGVVETVPYGTTDDTTLASFITTEKLFKEITGNAGYRNIDIQLEKKVQDQTVEEIKKLAGDSIIVGDRRQYNYESNNSYLTMALFLYGFVLVIALISILNIINTMNTSVASRTKYLGIMRAVGMSGPQLTGMILSEAAVYSICGCLAGCTIGVPVNRALSLLLLERWSFPSLQVAGIFLACLLAAAAAVVVPLKRIKANAISEVVSAL